MRKAWLLATLAVALEMSAAGAQTRPGVGYDAAARGKFFSIYWLDSILNSPRQHPIDFSARPDLVGSNPNPHYFDISQPIVRLTYELRWGPDTVGPRFKTWAGPSFEVASVMVEAMKWAYREDPALLGGDTSNRDGIPTLVESTDASATNDRDLYTRYLISEVPGFSPENRIHVCDPELPYGEIEGENAFYHLPTYSFNDYIAAVVSPPIPGAASCTP